MKYSEKFKRLNRQLEIIKRFQSQNFAVLTDLQKEEEGCLLSVEDANAEYTDIKEIVDLIEIARAKRIPLSNIIHSLNAAPTPSDYQQNGRLLETV